MRSIFKTIVVFVAPVLCLAQGLITTVAGTGTIGFSGDGGPATSAGFFLCGTAQHQGVAADNAGNVYMTDCGDNRIRKIDKAGVITTVAGKGSLGQSGFSGDGGAATAADLSSPYGIALDNAGNLYIADTGNGRIRKVDTAGVGDIEVNVKRFGVPPSNPQSRPLRWQHRRAMIAFAPRTVQNMPDFLRREPITVLQPASMTPEPTKRC